MSRRVTIDNYHSRSDAAPLVAYDNGDRTVSGPMHFAPDRDLAERLNARLRQIAADDDDRRDLLEMLLMRPRPRARQLPPES